MALWAALHRVVISCVKMSIFWTLIIQAWTLFRACVYVNCKEKHRVTQKCMTHTGTIKCADGITRKWSLPSSFFGG